MTETLKQILRALQDNQVEFILVGGMAAVLHGAPITTQDIDIVPRRDADNIRRLLAILDRLNARYRGQPAGRVLRPTVERLSGSGHNNLSTDLGPLDVLCELTPGHGYEQLLPDTESMTDGESSLLVITLPKLIALKTQAGRAKDRLTLPILMKLLKG